MLGAILYTNTFRGRNYSSSMLANDFRNNVLALITFASDNSGARLLLLFVLWNLLLEKIKEF